MKFKKILITGGAGFIGSHLSDHLIEAGYEVRVFDSLDQQIHPAQKIPNYLNSRVEFIRGDVTNREELKHALVDMDAVVHFAAAVGVGQSMYEVERYVRVNSLGTALLLDILANESHSIKKILIAGSMSAIGEGQYKCTKCDTVSQPALRNEVDLEKNIWEPLCVVCESTLVAVATTEEAILKSPSVYAITKKNQEELVLSIGKNYNIPAVSLRFFNVYGPRQSLSNPYTGVTAIFMSRVKNARAPVVNEDGLQSRDFVSVYDVVRACRLSLEKDEANYQIFNVGTGSSYAIKDVAQTIISLTGQKLSPQITNKYRKSDVRHCFADITKIKSVLGWTPQITFEKGLKELYEWAKNEEAIDKFDDAQAELKERNLV